MELVYLWVEEYKNIHKQGFNFSPRFRCEYDEEKNELNIIDKDETGEFYPKNFFGDNINITAIVGENGSGKSGILSGLNQIIAYSKDNNIVIFRLNDKLYCNKKCAFNKNIEILTEKVLLGRKNKYFSIITHTSDFIDSEIFLDRELSIYKEVHPMAIRDYDINSLNIMFMHLDLNYSNYLSYIQKLVFIMLINRESKIFFPNKYKISLHANFLIKKLFDISLYYPLDQDEILKNKCENYIYKLISKNDIDYIINFYFFMKKYSSNDKKYLDLVKYFSAEKFLTIDMLNISNDENIIRNKFLQVYTQTEDWINISLEKRNILNILFKCDKFSKMIIELFYIDLHDGIKSFSDLSTGEREYLLTEALIVEKINEGNFLFLLDEIDSSFHPNWSKELINNLIKTVSKHKVHIIISSHSPFLLSDLPKENVIFLEKDEKTGKCVNATEKMKDFSTFGANIHTLLSNGFFMKDGLMGEFAKEKIDLAIKYLNQKILTEDELNYCDNIISIIGEPIIKRELQRKLDSKRLSKIDKIEEIEEQMKLLQNRLEMIRKNQK